MGLAFIMPLTGGGGEYPGHDLPGQRPGRPDRPDNSLPALPHYPDHGLPDGGSVELPSNPIVIPAPPPGINPPPDAVWPGVPIHPLPPGNATLPIQPGQVYPPLPPSAGTGKALALIFISGIGARWTVLDLSLKPQPK